MLYASTSALASKPSLPRTSTARLTQSKAIIGRADEEQKGVTHNDDQDVPAVFDPSSVVRTSPSPSATCSSSHPVNFSARRLTDVTGRRKSQKVAQSRSKRRCPRKRRCTITSRTLQTQRLLASAWDRGVTTLVGAPRDSAMGSRRRVRQRQRQTGSARSCAHAPAGPYISGASLHPRPCISDHTFLRVH